MTFRHPVNGYQKRIDNAGAFTLIGGPIFFALHGIWLHAVLSAGLAFFTAGVSWLVYPLAAEGIVRNAYLSRGWTEVAEPPRERIETGPLLPQLGKVFAWVLLAVVVGSLLVGAIDWYLHPEFYARWFGYGQ